MPTSAKTRKPRSTRSSSSKALTPVDPADSPLDDAAGYEIGKQVNLGQLGYEIEQASGYEHVNLALSRTEDVSVLWVTPAGVDAGVLAQVIDAHQPNPTWGIPQAILDFNEALARLRDNPDGPLSEPDMVALVKGIALNFTALMPKPSG